MTDKELKELVSQTVRDTLLTLGVQHSEPIEMQKDFQHLREVRVSTEAIKRKGMLTLVGIFMLSIVSAVMLALKEYFR
jgi:hypothetical protein